MSSSTPLVLLTHYYRRWLLAPNSVIDVNVSNRMHAFLILIDFTNLDVFPADGKRFGFLTNSMDLETETALRKVCAGVFAVGNLCAVDPHVDSLALRENSIVVPVVFLIGLIRDFRFRSQQPATDTFEPDTSGIAVCSDFHLRTKKRFPVSFLLCLLGVFFRQAGWDFVSARISNESVRPS